MQIKENFQNYILEKEERLLATGPLFVLIAIPPI